MMFSKYVKLMPNIEGSGSERAKRTYADSPDTDLGLVYKMMIGCICSISWLSLNSD